MVGYVFMCMMDLYSLCIYKQPEERLALFKPYLHHVMFRMGYFNQKSLVIYWK